MVSKHEVRRGVYYDFVVLMQLQRALAALPEVEDAAVVMATPANRDVLASTGFDVATIEAKPEDLLIVVKAGSQQAADAALSQVDALLIRKQSSAGSDYRPRSLRAAASALPDANWVLISVPGRYAAGVAQEALDLGKHVFLYSDNVTLADEIKLKQQARAKGLLVMGPDCGTAIVNGVGLGFANRVRRGAVGIVAASGTGLQAVSSAVHELGAGVSQAFGTGGRDLKADVGGITALQALDLLGRDPQTAVIVLVSKPPAASVATTLLNAAQVDRQAGRRQLHRLPAPRPPTGQPPLRRQPRRSRRAGRERRLVRSAIRNIAIRNTSAGYLRGLFSGGTLAVETLLGLQATLSPLYSNVPLHPEQRLADSLRTARRTPSSIWARTSSPRGGCTR